MSDWDWIDEHLKRTTAYRVTKRLSLTKYEHRKVFETYEEAFKDLLVFFEEEKLKHDDLKFTEDGKTFYKYGCFDVFVRSVPKRQLILQQEGKLGDTEWA